MMKSEKQLQNLNACGDLSASSFGFVISFVICHSSFVILLVYCLAFFLAIPARSQPITFTTRSGYAGGGSADGTGPGALFSEPQFVAVDSAGKVYVADTGNNTIRVITPGGSSSTLAGSPGLA